jgi:hypothetical protein
MKIEWINWNLRQNIFQLIYSLWKKTPISYLRWESGCWSVCLCTRPKCYYEYKAFSWPQSKKQTKQLLCTLCKSVNWLQRVMSLVVVVVYMREREREWEWGRHKKYNKKERMVDQEITNQVHLFMRCDSQNSFFNFSSLSCLHCSNDVWIAWINNR